MKTRKFVDLRSVNFKFISFTPIQPCICFDRSRTNVNWDVIFVYVLLSNTPTADSNDSTKSIDRLRHDCDHSSTAAAAPTREGQGQNSESKNPSYRNNGASDSDLISEPAMDEVEADEIISAAEGFGGGARRDSAQQADKPQVQGKRTTTQPSTVRMLSKKLLLVNLLANFLMFAIAGFITYHCFYKATVLFSWHPTFMSIGVSISGTSVVCFGGLFSLGGHRYFLSKH